MGSLDEVPVDDVDAHLERDSSKHCLGDFGSQLGSHQDHQHQDHSTADARESTTASALDVDHCAHRGAGSGQTSKQTAYDVSKALAD